MSVSWGKATVKSLRSSAIEKIDSSSSSVLERMGGSLPKDNPLALAAGIKNLSAMSGFEKAGFSFRHCFVDIWVIVILLEGEGEVTCKRKSFLIKPGTVYIVPPGIPFHEHNTDNRPWKFACMLLHLSEKAKLFASLSKNRATFFDRGFDISEKTMDVIRALHFRLSGFEIMAIGGTLMTLGAIKERTDVKLGHEQSLIMTKAMNILKQNIKSPPSVPELAKLCNVSVSLLSHQFKKETGFPPMQYIKRERAKAAKELLLSGSSVEEAALKLGFTNQFHLSRVFSQVEGKSPIYFKKLSKRTLTTP